MVFGFELKSLEMVCGFRRNFVSGVGAEGVVVRLIVFKYRGLYWFIFKVIVR